MKFIILIVCTLCFNTSFGQQRSIAEIDKESELASQLWFSGKTEESMKLSEKNLTDSKEISYSNGIIVACINIAGILSDRQDYQKSDYYLKIAEKENLNVQSRGYTDEINGLKGDRYLNSDLFTKAIEVYKKNLNSSDLQAGAASSNIAVCFSLLKLPDSASFYDKQAYNLLIKTKEEGSERILAMVCNNLGIDYILRGDKLDSARFYLNKGLVLAKKIRQPLVLQNVKLGLGRFALKVHKIDSAILHFQEALNLAKSQKNAVLIKESYRMLISAYELKNTLRNMENT